MHNSVLRVEAWVEAKGVGFIAPAITRYDITSYYDIIYMYIYIERERDVYTNSLVCMYACMHVCMYICMCIYIYI